MKSLRKCSRCILCVLSLGLLAASSSAKESRPVARLNVFQKIADGSSVDQLNNTLSVDGLQRFVNTLIDQLDCDPQGNTGGSGCGRFMCINATDVLSTSLGLDPQLNITQENFEDVSVIVLDLITSVEARNLCQTVVDPSSVAVDSARTSLHSTLGLDSNHTHIPSTAVSSLLGILRDHKVDNIDENPGSMEHSGDSDSHSQEESMDHDAEAQRQRAADVVLHSKCMSYDSLKYHMGLGEEDLFEVASLPQLASLVAFMAYDESNIRDECRRLPYTEDFPNSIFHRFGDQVIDVAGMKELMTEMGIGTDVKSSEEHHGDHHRRRRSVQDGGIHKRHALGGMATCYSAEQLMGLYDAPVSVNKATFQEMCPALVSQRLFAECGGHDDGDDDSETSDLEKYGYGSIAIALICLSSFFGMLFLPCVGEKTYNTMMSVFVGLAMGTLFADAILHLIPMAMGAHVHGHGHEHGSKIKVETHVRIGLCLMGCLYGFYLLEIFISKFGGGCALHSKSSSDDSQVAVFSDIVKSRDQFEEVNGNLHPEAKTEKPKGFIREITSLPPLALMVVLGDAVHNFADGLAVAAAFSQSMTSGVSTSIAIFCHELPHELGDFAVLLQSGCSFKKAVLLNLVSALTAFIGLYVGIQVATSEETQAYIFAAAAAMFMYIALVDLLPTMTRAKSNYHLLLNNIGILAGYAILFLIAIFEEHIRL